MGCGGSTDTNKKSPVNNASRSSGVSSSPYNRRPKISIRVGAQVPKCDRVPHVVFIFGGPGSRKGRIVDDLKNSYGFRHICTEEIIFKEFPRKVANVMTIETVKDIEEALESDPSHISASWVLSMVERTIEREAHSHKHFVVDYIPNLKYMLKIDLLMKDMDDALRRFEEKYPISFALNLAVPADKVLKAKQVFCASPEAKEKMKETGGQGDEADSARIQRRAQLFNNNVKRFLDYFSATDRLVTVDVTCGVADLIWNRVNEFLCDLQYTPSRTVNTVLVFAFDDSDAVDIDYDKYLMEKVSLQEIVENPNDSVENLLKLLSQHIDRDYSKHDSFVVRLSGTAVTKESIQKLTNKLILFAEVEEGSIDKYLPGSPKNFVPSKDASRYKAVCSVENEICLFPTTTKDSVCKYIASVLAHSRLL